MTVLTRSSDAVPALSRMPRWAMGAWAAGGVGVMFLEAICRLGLRSVSVAQAGLHWHEAAVLLASLLLFGYGEGYRALHRRFVPGVFARIARLPPPHQLSWARWITLPLYALGLVYLDRGSLARGWLAVALIVLAVVVVRALPEPWRAIVDGGVAVALLVGLISLVRAFLASLKATPPAAS